jgi:hypothetical protein
MRMGGVNLLASLTALQQQQPQHILLASDCTTAQTTTIHS